VTGTFLFCQGAGKVMIEGSGKIINIVSVGSVVGFKRQIAYCAA
jgi:NAD(P)-dependent dehydrogenase (short-subunit alcohol dehydrogenase family)